MFVYEFKERLNYQHDNHDNINPILDNVEPSVFNSSANTTNEQQSAPKVKQNEVFTSFDV